MSAFGGVFAGPVLSNWYRFIDKKVTTTNRFKGKLGAYMLEIKH